jgi:Fe-S-cluster containining protein
MDDKSWFQKGLRFECTGCGDCCTGAPGFVWVNRDEIEALANKLDISVADFEAKYVRQVGIRKSLIEYANGDCVFFDPATRKCTVYDARPRQCRTWPFWESNVRTEQAWNKTCEVCPGSGQGKLHSAAQILHQISIVKL